MYDKSIVSYNQSKFMDNNLVLSTVKHAIEAVLIVRERINSSFDQGVHLREFNMIIIKA